MLSGLPGASFFVKSFNIDTVSEVRSELVNAQFFSRGRMIWLFFIYLLLISWVDYNTKIIGDGLTLLGILVVLNYQLFFGDMQQVVWGINAGIGIVWIMNVLKLNKVGGGDAKLMALIGAFTGWQIAISNFLISIIIFMPVRYKLKQKAIAYAPFITGAFVVVKLCQTVIFTLKS